MPQAEWNPPDNGLCRVPWTGGENEEFSPVGSEGFSRAKIVLGDILHDLWHPQSDCWHSGKSMPPFFNSCPYCGTTLRDDLVQGTWLPPFGWSPFCGLPKDAIYHPQSLSEPIAWSEPEGTGPIRMWLCPVGNGERSVWYAYRPKRGTIYYLDPNHLGQFQLADIEGEPEARRALRGDPVGGMARNWSPAWFADRLLFSTASGLLALEFLESGRIRAELLLPSPCIASPAVSLSEQMLMVPCWYDGKVQIAALVEEENRIQFKHLLTWKDDVEPEVDLSRSVSLPSGALGGDIYWIFANGIVAAEGGESAQWYPVVDSIELEPRVSPDARGAEIKVFGWEGNRLKSYPLLGLKKETGEDADLLLYPSGGADRNYWLANGVAVSYHFGPRGANDEDLRKWPLSIWRLSSALQRKDTPVLLLGDFQKLTRLDIFPTSGGKTVSLKEIELYVGGETILEAQRMGFTQQIQMPLDTMIFPISAETVIFYGGDHTPVTSAISLIDFRPKNRDGGAG